MQSLKENRPSDARAALDKIDAIGDGALSSTTREQVITLRETSRTSSGSRRPTSHCRPTPKTSDADGERLTKVARRRGLRRAVFA
jgi:hypothetical protein